MHQRQHIRDAVVTALIGAVQTSAGPPPVFSYATPAGPRVQSTRVFEWRVSALPGISVYTVSERVDDKSIATAPTELDRRLDLAVELAIEAGDNPDVAIDDFTQAVEKAMHIDETFGGACSRSILETTEIEVIASDKMIAMCRLIYAVRYFTYAPEADDTPLDAFTSAGIKYKVSGPLMPDEDDAEDEIAPAQ